MFSCQARLLGGETGNQQQNRAGNGPRVNITHLLGAGSGCCVGLDKIQAMGSEYSESREGTGIILRCWKRLASVVRASHYAITVGRWYYHITIVCFDHGDNQARGADYTSCESTRLSRWKQSFEF